MTFQEWRDYARMVRAMAQRIDDNRHERGWAIALAAGIGRCGCSLHNCSIAEIGQGWGANPGGRERIKAAKAATRLIDDWSASRIADRIIDRAWQRYRDSQV